MDESEAAHTADGADSAQRSQDVPRPRPCSGELFEVVALISILGECFESCRVEGISNKRV